MTPERAACADCGHPEASHHGATVTDGRTGVAQPSTICCHVEREYDPEEDFTFESLCDCPAYLTIATPREDRAR